MMSIHVVFSKKTHQSCLGLVMQGMLSSFCGILYDPYNVDRIHNWETVKLTLIVHVFVFKFVIENYSISVYRWYTYDSVFHNLVTC